MKIGLIDVDSKIPNLALMKISAYHKSQDDDVEFYNPMFHYDKIYYSKIFNFTDDYLYPLNADQVIKGGSGYDITEKLPDEIENIIPDYQLYPNIDYAMGFTTRGCIRNCEFCIVPKKEGMIRPVADIYDFWEGQKEIKLLDNNLTAHKHFYKVVQQIIDENISVDFTQGLDIRLMNDKKANLLSQLNLKHNRQIRFAFDDIKDKKIIRKGIETLLSNGVKYYRIMFYVLVGFNSTPAEDLERIRILQEYKIDPFVMPYKDINGYDTEKIRKRCGFDNKYKYEKYLQQFSRWVNHKGIYRTVKWEDYKG